MVLLFVCPGLRLTDGDQQLFHPERADVSTLIGPQLGDSPAGRSAAGPPEGSPAAAGWGQRSQTWTGSACPSAPERS